MESLFFNTPNQRYQVSTVLHTTKTSLERVDISNGIFFYHGALGKQWQQITLQNIDRMIMVVVSKEGSVKLADHISSQTYVQPKNSVTLYASSRQDMELVMQGEVFILCVADFFLKRYLSFEEHDPIDFFYNMIQEEVSLREIAMQPLDALSLYMIDKIIHIKEEQQMRSLRCMHRVIDADSDLVAEFKQIFGVERISFEAVRKAIGAYERTLLTHGAYDRFLEGEDDAISAKAKRGMTLFIVKGCKGCHTGMSVGGQRIEKFPLRHYFMDYIGMALDPSMKIKESPFPFENKGGFLGQNNKLKFKVPILRNITKTAPYFHNGNEKKIEEVVRIMSKYQLGDEFSPKQIDEVVAFLKTLEGELVSY